MKGKTCQLWPSGGHRLLERTRFFIYNRMYRMTVHPRDMSGTGRGEEAAATAPASPIPAAATAEAAGISSTDAVDGLKCFLTLQALLQRSGLGRQATGFPAFRGGCNRYHAGLSEEQYEKTAPRGGVRLHRIAGGGPPPPVRTAAARGRGVPERCVNTGITHFI